MATAAVDCVGVLPSACMLHKLGCVARQAAAEGLLLDTQAASGASDAVMIDGGQAVQRRTSRTVHDKCNALECMGHELGCLARQAAAEGLPPDTQGAAGASRSV
jgi:hypothetical protein